MIIKIQFKQYIQYHKYAYFQLKIWRILHHLLINLSTHLQIQVSFFKNQFPSIKVQNLLFLLFANFIVNFSFIIVKYNYNKQIIGSQFKYINTKSMGNQIQSSSSSSRFHPPTEQHQLQILYECEQGDVVQSTLNSRQYLIRQLSFSNEEQLQNIYKQLKQYENENKSGMILNLLNIQKKCIKNMCGSQNRIRLIFEYSLLSINDQIQARKAKLQYFDINDCYRIMIGSIRAIQEIQEQRQKYPKLVQNYILNNVFVQPERILLMENGLIKICNPLVVSTYDRFQHKNNTYYSPQKLNDFDYIQDNKSIIFQLGITLIHIFLLKDCKDIYNGFQVKQDTIDSKILQIWNIYGDVMLCQVLNKMTRTYRNIRSDLVEIVQLVTICQERMMERLHKQLITANANRSGNNKNNEMLIEQDNYEDNNNQMQDQTYRQQNKYKNNSILGNSNHQYCISTYSTYTNKYPQSNIKNHKQNYNQDNKQISLFQYDSKFNNNKNNVNKNKKSICKNSILESRIQNIKIYNNNQSKQVGKKQTNSLCVFENSNNFNFNLLQNTKKDLKQSILKNSNYKNIDIYKDNNQNKENIMKYCNIVSNMAKQQQSSKIASQPLNNMKNKSRNQSITSYNNHKDQSISSVFKQQKQPINSSRLSNKCYLQNNQQQQLYIKQTQSIIRYKESYQYGQQLTEGLYVKQKYTNKNNNMVNFEWKRTQFNKKSDKNNILNNLNTKNSLYVLNESQNKNKNVDVPWNLATSKYLNTSKLQIENQDYIGYI